VLTLPWRQVDPPGAPDTQDVLVCEYRDIAIDRAHAFDHPVNPAADTTQFVEIDMVALLPEGSIVAPSRRSWRDIGSGERLL
jgi:hypothetical protein